MADVTVLALSTNQTAWWITLAVAVLVLVVVGALLEGLRRTVRRVEEAASAAWAGGAGVEGNTVMTYLLKNTRERGAELVEELDQHREEMRGAKR